MLSRSRAARGFTLVEVIVVVAIIAAMSAMATGIFSGPVQFYRARRSMEKLLWDLRLVQQKARSRGFATGAAGGTVALYGVQFFPGSTTWNGAQLVPLNLGFSYLVYGPVTAPPANSLAGLTPGELGNVVNLDISLTPCQMTANGANPAVNAPVRADMQNPAPAGTGPRLQFDPNTQGGQADVVPDATSPLGVLGAAPQPYMDFILQTQDGFFRLSIDNQRYIGLRYAPLP